MAWQKIQLEIPEKTVKSLKDDFARVVTFIENGGSLNTRVLQQLADNMSAVVAANKQFMGILNAISGSGDFFHLNLCHPDAEILNLPWGMALDPVSNRPLNEIPQLLISKNSQSAEAKAIVPTKGPLKILVMISSPKDLPAEGRLHFEEEERRILQAFEPLFTRGEVQIDFTDNGSLAALKRKIDRNDYHILHFSGHGFFDAEAKQSFLLLENDLSLRAKPASAREFAEALLKPRHTVPLVILSSCQTAKASHEKALAGITGTLMQKGVPAVIGMGLSIRDTYATSFAAHLYQRLAEKKSLAEAFSHAREQIRAEEAEEIRRQNLRTLPMQWMIPNLYLAGETEIVNWDAEFERLMPEDSRIIFANTTMEKSKSEIEQFVGRREDLARIVPVLADKKPILLKGQGGIGKTTLAHKLIQRLLAAQPNLIPFVFNEEGKGFSLTTMLDQLKEFCLRHERKDWLDYLQLFGDQNLKQLFFLLDKIGDTFPVIFLFDNLESFQNLESEEFTTDHEATLAVIARAARHPKIQSILTGRFPVKELQDEVDVFDVNDIDLNDFIRKCYNLGLSHLSQKQMEFLFRTLGGNFRTLEFFYRDFAAEPENMRRAYADLESFTSAATPYSEQALREMAENLIFDRLWQQLPGAELDLATTLYRFALPVTETALRLQGYGDPLMPKLKRLQDLTLVQIYWDREASLLYYFMPPLVKNLWQRRIGLQEPQAIFHERAGRYHYYMYTTVQRGSISELDAAYWQFLPAGNAERLNVIGKQLASFYYGRALYANALLICHGVEKLLAEKLPWWCGNRIGQITFRIRQYDIALHYFQSALDALDEAARLSPEEKTNKGTTLNNISQIYDARGDYDTALDYLKKSLKISQEIGDKSGQGTTLNNISALYHARGDYDTALDYLKKSLKIRQEIGDKSGLIATWHNMAMIEYAKENFPEMLALETRAYQLATETQDAMGLFTVGRMFGQVLVEAGQKQEGVAILRRAFEIGQSAGLPGTEEIKEILRQSGE